MGVDSVPVAPGDIVVALAWSNVATTMHVSLNFQRKLPPGDKSPEVITLSTNDFATGSNRAVTSGTLTIPFEGSITGLSGVGLSGGGTQRGQTFVNVLLTRAGTSITVVQTLAQDYFYTGNTLTLGQVVEPGPAGGAGNMRDIALTDPAANTEFAQTVPTGAMWLLRSLSVQIVQGITQTPLPALRMDGPLGKIAQIPAMTTALGASTTAQLTWGVGLTLEQFLAVVGDEMYTAPLPVVYLNAADTFGSITDGIGANTNYGAAIVRVEEWVMPN